MSWGRKAELGTGRHTRPLDETRHAAEQKSTALIQSPDTHLPHPCASRSCHTFQGTHFVTQPGPHPDCVSPAAADASLLLPPVSLHLGQEPAQEQSHYRPELSSPEALQRALEQGGSQAAELQELPGGSEDVVLYSVQYGRSWGLQLGEYLPTLHNAACKHLGACRATARGLSAGLARKLGSHCSGAPLCRVGWLVSWWLADGPPGLST